MTELKSCPFCEGKATLVSDWFDEHRVVCNDCGAATAVHISEESAAKAWNSRPTLTEEELLKAREEMCSARTYCGDCPFDAVCEICDKQMLYLP